MEPRAEVQQRRWASAKIQTLGHFRLARNRVRRRKAAIVNIQRRMRGNIASRNFAWKLTCANAIQRATRAMLIELTDKAARGEVTERGIEQLQEELARLDLHHKREVVLQRLQQLHDLMHRTREVRLGGYVRRRSGKGSKARRVREKEERQWVHESSPSRWGS